MEKERKINNENYLIIKLQDSSSTATSNLINNELSARNKDCPSSLMDGTIEVKKEEVMEATGQNGQIDDVGLLAIIFFKYSNF